MSDQEDMTAFEDDFDGEFHQKEGPLDKLPTLVRQNTTQEERRDPTVNTGHICSGHSGASHKKHKGNSEFVQKEKELLEDLTFVDERMAKLNLEEERRMAKVKRK